MSHLGTDLHDWFLHEASCSNEGTLAEPPERGRRGFRLVGVQETLRDKQERIFVKNKTSP